MFYENVWPHENIWCNLQDSALDADMSRVSEVLASATDVIKCDIRLLQNLEKVC